MCTMCIIHIRKRLYFNYIQFCSHSHSSPTRVPALNIFSVTYEGKIAKYVIIPKYLKKKIWHYKNHLLLGGVL